MSTVVKDLGAATAYGYAVEKGYTGTEAEFAELMASYATVGQTAVTAAQTATTKASEAATSATTATNKATEATTAATTATNKAAEAQADADAAALDASQALSAASTATTKATEATTAAATATSAKTDAVAANTAAQSAKTAAQTAQTGAETAAASVQSSAAQIATNAEDISQLKSDLSKGACYSCASAIRGKYLNTTGTLQVNASYGYLYFPYFNGDVEIIGATACIINYWNSAKDTLLGTSGWVIPNGIIKASTIPSGTAYISLSFKLIDIDRIAIYTLKFAKISTIEDNVSALQDATKMAQINVIRLESGNFFDSDGTTKNANTARIRNTVPIPINKYSKIVIPDGYGLWIFRLDKDLQLISAVGSWKTGTVDVSSILVNAVEYINFGIRKTATPSADITADISTVQNGLHFEYASDAVESVSENEILHYTNNARHIKENVGTPLTILHFSDLHKDESALHRIMTDAESYGTLIDDCICTGDMVANTYGQISTWWDADVLTCIGNHDTASYTEGVGYNWTALSMADRDAYYIAPFESGWGIVHTAGTSYYYKDYATQKVRLIVMDGMLYTGTPGSEATAQTAWLANLLSDAITNSLHVLIAIHSPHGGAVAKECSFSRYGQGTMPTWTDCNTPQTVIDTVAAAITNGLLFIGYIVGHTHQDNIWDAEGDGSQLMYCVTCAAVRNQNQWKNSDQYRGVDADAYNLVTIDTTNTLVKIVRGGGADIDDHMRTRKAICFNYTTGEIIGQVL